MNLLRIKRVKLFDTPKITLELSNNVIVTFPTDFITINKVRKCLNNFNQQNRQTHMYIGDHLFVVKYNHLSIDSIPYDMDKESLKQFEEVYNAMLI